MRTAIEAHNNDNNTRIRFLSNLLFGPVFCHIFFGRLEPMSCLATEHNNSGGGSSIMSDDCTRVEHTRRQSDMCYTLMSMNFNLVCWKRNLIKRRPRFDDARSAFVCVRMRMRVCVPIAVPLRALPFTSPIETNSHTLTPNARILDFSHVRFDNSRRSRCTSITRTCTRFLIDHPDEVDCCSDSSQRTYYFNGAHHTELTCAREYSLQS